MYNELLKYIITKEHHKYRKDINLNLANEYSARNLSAVERMADRFEKLTKFETPIILPNEKIVFIRTIMNIPEIYVNQEWEDIKSRHFIHELGYISNIAPDYESTISSGLLEKRKKADEFGKRAIDNIIALSDRYKKEAEIQERFDIVNILEHIPRYGARNFREALQFFRIIHYSLWLEGNYHNTIGRFDKYMFPYLKKDMDEGFYTEDSALELLEDFFLSFNKDSDLYPGVQQGDNGQSLVLGGIDENGNEVFNLLSKLCLIASKNLKLIDPKINLRVNKNTQLEIYELGSELTKAGLGFPQYSNDDIVIDGLVELGYDLKDARDYVVAACWEFIIPKFGADIVNIAALSFPKIIDTSLHKHLKRVNDFNEFMNCVHEEILQECKGIARSIKKVWFIPSPFMNILFDCKDVSTGAKYNNFGVHGTGIATAADSLIAIKKYIFDEKSITVDFLIEAVDSDFTIHNELLPILRYNTPKMGQNDDSVDSIAVELLETFSNSLKGMTNCRGGCYRAGTGSAMYYLWHANELGASPDGRRKGEAFGTNFSPSLFAKTNGPFSIIKSFIKPNIKKAVNGGPLTLEFHNSIFLNKESITKVAIFLRSFINIGGHQIQVNAVNSDTLIDAQKHPERYSQMVVRVWGWSAYFVELDKEYQDHIISRKEYLL